MFQLVYISTACAPISEEMVASILASSRANNQRDGISGLLVVGGRRFLQALEGPEEAVFATYARIKQDSRHHALVLLTGRQVPERVFGGWSMACELADNAEVGGGLIEIVDALTTSLMDRSLRAHFMGFAELHARAA